MYKRLVAILIALMSLAAAGAQELEWSVDMNAVFNNREGGNGETPDQTFLFTRITPQIGVSMDSTRHRIMSGVTWYQPMNDHLHGYKVMPSLYYYYKDREKGLDFKFGVIPNVLDSKIPTFLRSDSINYVQPNIKGAVFCVHKPNFVLESWLDWRQIQTEHHREAFDATAYLAWKNRQSLCPQDHFYAASVLLHYNHLAKSRLRLDGEGVVDNVLLTPEIDYLYSINNNSTIFLSAGMLLTIDRDRISENKWLTQAGFLGHIRGTWKWLTLEEQIYAGKQQMPLYQKYGSLLYQGDQFYHNKFYSRTDLKATIFNNEYLNLEARVTFHATDKTTAFWQQVAVRFYIDKKIWKKAKDKKPVNHGIVIRDYLPAQF